MTDIKQYFIDQEERVSNTYMSASGEPQLQKPPKCSFCKVRGRFPPLSWLSNKCTLRLECILGGVIILYFIYKQIKK